MSSCTGSGAELRSQVSLAGEAVSVGAVAPHPLQSLCPFCPTQISHPALSQRLSSPASPPAAEANLSRIPPTAAPT